MRGYAGYIKLNQFTEDASHKVEQALIKLGDQGAKGYIFDLRGNPGGLLEASIDISRQFLDKGIIVSTKTRSGIKDVRRAKGNALTNKPLAILVDGGSASAWR